jgi:hypothetical protein
MRTSFRLRAAINDEEWTMKTKGLDQAELDQGPRQFNLA